MYTIFINDRTLVLCNHDEGSALKNGRLLLDNTGTENVIKWINSDTDAVAYGHDPQALLKGLMASFPVIRAAGGIVSNPQKEILAILRHGLWDLPKGKCDAGESEEETATREVAEECRPGRIELREFAGKSYHMYPIGQNWVLKENWWFTMDCPQPMTPVPQREEGIEAVCWCNRDDLSLKMQSGHASIRKLLGDFGFID